MKRIYVFFGLFCLVYLLESISSTYIISALQSIERQFQLSSRVSGFLVSASDLGYIPTVIVISYFGSHSKNRARWIGIGTLMTAIANYMIASTNFLFAAKNPIINMSSIEAGLLPPGQLFDPNPSLTQLFNYSAIRDRFPSDLMAQVLHHEELAQHDEQHHRWKRAENYSIDGPLIEEALMDMNNFLSNRTTSSLILKNRLVKFVHRRLNNTARDALIIRKAAMAPFSFCGQTVNELRNIVKQLRCETESNIGPLIVIFVALVIVGIGRTMPWALGLPLVDDNVKRKSLPTYYAGLSFIRVLGPSFGFIIGSICNRFYYTLQAPAGLTAKDPTWIGAWWLGFMIISTFTILPSLMLICFPDPKKQKLKVVPVEKANGEIIEGLNNKKLSICLADKHLAKKADMTVRQKLADVCWSITHSPVFVASVCARVLDVLAFRGYKVFLPKYLEHHYGIPQYNVYLYMALFGVTGFAMGVVTGSQLMKKFKMEGRRAAGLVLFVSAANLVIFYSKIGLGCHSVVSQIGSQLQRTNSNLIEQCNADCGCAGAKLFPVCAENGRAFYSPCHAGCRVVNVSVTGAYDFGNCECVKNGGGMVKKEWCHGDCFAMTAVFLVLMFFGSFVAGNGVVPGMIILIRSVPPAYRSVSLGFQGFLVSLLGTLPSPTIWGFLIDDTCVQWDQPCPDAKGACVIYDPQLMRTWLHVVYGGLRTCALVFDVVVIYYAKDLRLLTEEEDKQTDNGRSMETSTVESETNSAQCDQPKQPDIPISTSGVYCSVTLVIIGLTMFIWF